MSRLMLQRKGVVRAAAISAAGLLGAGLSTSAFGASLTVGLQSQTGSTGAVNSTIYLTPQGYNVGTESSPVYSTAPINVYVYGTVTGSAPTTSSNLDGLQFLYYNVANATGISGTNNVQVPGSITAANVNSSAAANFNGGLELSNTAPSGLTGNGVQQGAMNSSAGISLGSTTATTLIAKPRAAGVVWDSSPDGTNVYTSGNSASFLVQTIQFTPTNIGPSPSTPFVASSTLAPTTEVKTILSAAIPTATQLSNLPAANYLTDGPAPATTPPGGTLGTTISGTGSTVNIVDAVAGDANGDGTVNFSDLSLVTSHYNTVNTNWTQGNFLFYTQSSADTTINFSDLSLVTSHYNTTFNGAFPNDVDIPADQALLNDPQAVALLQSVGLTAVPAAVPEPVSAGMLGVLGAATLMRRRNRSA
jgi:hypothetical protein